MPGTPVPDPSISARLERLAAEWAKDPHSKVFVQLAEEYVKAGLLQKAAVVLQEGLLVYPGYVIAMVALGSIYQQMGEAAKAKAILEDAVALSPENLKAHRSLAKIYAAEGNIESARKSCTVVLMTNPLDDEIKTIERSLAKIKNTPPAKPLETASAEVGTDAGGPVTAASADQAAKSSAKEEEGIMCPAAPSHTISAEESDGSA
ncbi:MAG TPA: tetratricopeptide repeat protein, partial [Nitrospiraceae bacterium]|nr:tetratricopeptide repeat protein [Nitrospiraceae bacterium]